MINISQSIVRAAPQHFTYYIMQYLHFILFLRGKSSKNRTPQICPLFKFELIHLLILSVAFLLHRQNPMPQNTLLPLHIFLKVNVQFDQKIPLLLSMVRIVPPIVHVILRTKNQQARWSVVHPVGGVPLLHNQGSERGPREDGRRHVHELGGGEGGCLVLPVPGGGGGSVGSRRRGAGGFPVDGVEADVAPRVKRLGGCGGYQVLGAATADRGEGVARVKGVLGSGHRGNCNGWFGVRNSNGSLTILLLLDAT
mmetsp:Transcript_40176/g.85540  ORF Transcript_40176/g.85540 Transcript_40176/m.85540 type:complete len:253 (-) Transcript_40176:795-1553(-)